jgi:RNA polymerase sigma-70 factor (family 1)
MVYQHLTDQLLLTKCSAGDVDAYHEIYHRYKHFVFNTVAARLADADDAKDMTQDIFIKLWTLRERLIHINDIRPYLYTLSRNHVISAYRKQNIRIKGEQFLLNGLTDIQYSAEDQRLANELDCDIQKLVSEMPETMRHCYQLSKNEGRKNGEIATLLNISEKTVRNNLSEALKQLRLTLQNSHPELLAVILCLSITNSPHFSSLLKVIFS